MSGEVTAAAGCGAKLSCPGRGHGDSDEKHPQRGCAVPRRRCKRDAPQRDDVPHQHDVPHGHGVPWPRAFAWARGAPRVPWGNSVPRRDVRVPVVRGPKTFCKTIFHANSLSEDPGADASPTRVIRSTDCLRDCWRRVRGRQNRLFPYYRQRRAGPFTIADWKNAQSSLRPIQIARFAISPSEAQASGVSTSGWAFGGSKFGNGSRASSRDHAATQSSQRVRVRAKTSDCASTAG